MCNKLKNIIIRYCFILIALLNFCDGFDSYIPTHKPRQLPANFESLAQQMREIRREIGEIHRETRQMFSSLQNDISWEIGKLKEELMGSGFRPRFSERDTDTRLRSVDDDHSQSEAPYGSRDYEAPAHTVREFEKRMKRGFKKITEQGDEIRNELRSQKAELYAVRNSVYDTREEILQKNNIAIRGIQEANDTFVCYMHAMRKKLYQVNNNIATVVREQQMLLDSLHRPQYSTPDALMPTVSYDEPFEEDNVHDEPSTTDRFLPGCTKNPLETQETLETFGIVFSNDSTMTPDPYLRGTYDRDPVYGRHRSPPSLRDRPHAAARNRNNKHKERDRELKQGTLKDAGNRGRGTDPYDKARTGFDRIRAGLDSLFPTKPEDCQENPETYLEYPPMPRDCQDVLDLGFIESGVYRIQPMGLPSREVTCDQSTDGGGWTVIIARKKVPRHISFNRTWPDYEKGFGEPSREYWIGKKYSYFDIFQNYFSKIQLPKMFFCS